MTSPQQAVREAASALRVDGRDEIAARLHRLSSRFESASALSECALLLEATMSEYASTRVLIKAARRALGVLP